MRPGLSCDALPETQIIYGGPNARTGSSGSFSLKRQYPTADVWKTIAYEFDIWVFTTSELPNATTLYSNRVYSMTFGIFSPTPEHFVLNSSCSTDFNSTRGTRIKYIYKYHVQQVVTLSSPSSPMSVRLTISGLASASIDSLAFRNFKVYNFGSVSSSAQGYQNFPCSDSYFWNGTNCQGCPSECLSCSNGKCTACKSSYYDYGNGTCLTTACSGIFQTISGTNQCTKKCATGFYWPRNSSCVETCEEPLVQSLDQNGLPVCSSPCADTAEFVYPNRSCSSACDPLLKEIKETTIKLCLNPCDPAEYLYPDGSCKACLSPLSQSIKQEIQYCENPCFHNKTFLYEDATCQETCPSPSISKEDPSFGKTCKFPCSDKSYYYNTQSRKCTKTCEYPGEAIDSPLPKLCKSSLSEEEVKQVRAIADAANNANTASSTGAMIWSFISSSDSTSACLGPLAKMLQYIRFMDIMYPEKVLILMDVQSKDSGGFSTKMMKGALDKFPSHELPRKFQIYQASSSFFVNFWPALFNLSVILFVTLLVVA